VKNAIPQSPVRSPTKAGKIVPAIGGKEDSGVAPCEYEDEWNNEDEWHDEQDGYAGVDYLHKVRINN
jgi:hypothetical protein